MNSTGLILEPLEARIAPAGVTILNPQTATTTDSDGDLVTVKITKGTLTDANFTTTSAGDGYQLNVLDLSNAQYEGTDIIITAKPQTGMTGGDGFVNVGVINAVGIHVGKVVVPGDVGQINIGDTNTAGDLTVKSLQVGSIGGYGVDTGASADLQSNIYGNIGKMTVGTDLRGKFVVNGNTTDGKTGGIGVLTIGGSIIGGADYTGWMQITGDVKTVKVAGDLDGAGISSGRIQMIYGTADSVSIGGSLNGGAGENSGQLYVPSGVKKITVGGSLNGGAGDLTGYIYQSGTKPCVLSVGGSLTGAAGLSSGGIDGNFSSVTVKGSLAGGGGDYSGAFYSNVSATLPVVKVQGNLIGGAGHSSASITAPTFKSVQVGGSVVGGGSGNYSGSVNANSGGTSGLISIGGNLEGGGGNFSGAVQVSSLKSLLIGGSLISGGGTSSGSITSVTIQTVEVKGAVSGTSAHPAQILASGLLASLPDNLNQDLAIGKITVGGSVTWANFLAGFNSSGNGINGDASIGSVLVKGDWVTSSISAGIGAGADGWYGSDAMNDDVNLASPTTRNLVSTISSIVIGGQVRGTYGTSADSFAIQAEKLGTLKIGQVDYSSQIGGAITNANIYLGPVFTMLSDIRAIEKP